MRNITLLFLFITTSVCSLAQDIIVLKDSTFIKAKVLEVGLNEIKYKKYNYLDGPFYIISKDEVSKIKFENGTSETMINHTSEIFQSENTLNSVGFGFGQEYGEIGIRVQRKFSEKSDFAIRVGVGSREDLYFPLGIKCYLNNNIYLDLGSTWNVVDREDYKVVVPYNFSLTLGTDIHLTNRIACNASAGLASYDSFNSMFEVVGICWSFGFYYKL